MPRVEGADNRISQIGSKNTLAIQRESRTLSVGMRIGSPLPCHAYPGDGGGCCPQVGFGEVRLRSEGCAPGSTRVESFPKFRKGVINWPISAQVSTSMTDRVCGLRKRSS